MGMRRPDLMALTLTEFIEARRGFEELEEERTIEARRMARIVAYYSAGNYKLTSFQQIFRLPGEKATTLSVEEMKQRHEQHLKRYREMLEREANLNKN